MSDAEITELLKAMLDESLAALQDKRLYNPAVEDFIRMFAAQRGIKL